MSLFRASVSRANARHGQDRGTTRTGLKLSLIWGNLFSTLFPLSKEKAISADIIDGLKFFGNLNFHDARLIAMN